MSQHTNQRSERQTATPTRRSFLRTSTTVAAGGLGAQAIAPAAYAGEDNTLRVGLIGCGGRGTGAAVQALKADKQTQLVAMGDVFEDKLLDSLSRLNKSNVGKQVQVDAEKQFVGFDAYQKVIDATDVVLIATPPHFRPMHVREAANKGRNIFAEKPAAVDAPGIRSFLETGKIVDKKGISLVSGLCWRYEKKMQQTIDEIHQGRIGQVVAMETSRYLGDVGKVPHSNKDWTPMEHHLRNWYYYTWLSGDGIVEQFVHELDKMAWVLGDVYPERCYSTGGRIVRTSEDYGHIYDHFNAVFEYESGVKLFAGHRQTRKCDSVRLDLAMGTQGKARLMDYRIWGEFPWRLNRNRTNMYQREHDAFFGAIRNNEPINNTEYMAKSTMMAIMARESAYCGKNLTWKEIMSSKRKYAPEKYAWDAEPPKAKVADPAEREFV